MDLFNLTTLQQGIAKKIEFCNKKTFLNWGFPFQGWVAGLVQNTDDFESYVL